MTRSDKQEPPANPALPFRLQRFVELLRDNDFKIGASEFQQIHLLSCTTLLHDRASYRICLRAILSRNRQDWARFYILFEQFWARQSDQLADEAATAQSIVQSAAGAAGLAYFSESQADATMRLGNTVDDEQTAHTAGGASDTRVLSQRDFRFVFRAAEMRRIELMVDQIARRIRRRTRRRTQISKRRGTIDLRRTAHANLQYGGWPFQLHYRRRRRSAGRFVIILDVSQSMEIYSYLFLRFARGLLQGFADTDAYAFHTDLIPIGAELKEKNITRLENKLRNLSSGWLGGTRISSCLEEFNQSYAQATLDRNTMLLIFSDGYDSGEPAELVEQMEQLKSRVRRLVWINPLLGRTVPGSAAEDIPAERCINAVQPLLDLYTGAHSVDSLKNLEAAFALN